jgi:hypothetical protein
MKRKRRRQRKCRRKGKRGRGALEVKGGGRKRWWLAAEHRNEDQSWPETGTSDGS